MGNLNDLARKVAALEGGVRELSIAEIREVIACVGAVLRRETVWSALCYLWAIWRRAGRRK